MQDTPPRRPRRPPPKDSGSSFPLIPIVLGTIVIGFVIGAGLSIAGKHGSDRVAVATPVPAIEATLAPATLAPTEVPTREPTVEPATIAPATHAPATRAPATHAPATHAPATRAPERASPAPASPAAATATNAPAVTASASASAGAAVLAPSATTRPRLQHSPAVQAAVTTAAAPSDAPAIADDADSDFARLAASVVRGYLSAVARGDGASAASSLASSSDRVTETGVVDASTRIKHVEARGAGEAATVNVDFDTAKGNYFGQYTVRRTSSGAAVIVAHTIIKP